MQIKVTAKEFTAVILDDHGNVALDYKVDNYTFNADLQALANAAAALAHHVEALCK